MITDDTLDDVAKNIARACRALERIAAALENLDANGILAYIKPTEEEE